MEISAEFQTAYCRVVKHLLKDQCAACPNSSPSKSDLSAKEDSEWMKKAKRLLLKGIDMSKWTALDNEDLSDLDKEECLFSAAALLSDKADILIDNLLKALLSEGHYDSRSRELVFRFASLLQFDALSVLRLEFVTISSLAERALHPNNEASADCLSHSDTSQAMENSAKKYQKRKLIYTGLAAIGGGVLIGVTGGLAAPLIGAGLASTLSAIGIGGTAAFFGSLGGVALITSFFGVAGAGIGSYRMSRRTRGVSEFFFIPHIYLRETVGTPVSAKSESSKSLNLSQSFSSLFRSLRKSRSSDDGESTRESTRSSDMDESSNERKNNKGGTKNYEFFIDADSNADKELVPFPFVTITMSGWVRSLKDFVEPWTFLDTSENDAVSNSSVYLNGEHLSLCWETEELVALSGAVENILVSEAVSYAAVQALSQTILAGLLAAVVIPSSLIKVASLLDNPWAMAIDRASKCGLVLADLLCSYKQGRRPVILIGTSIACRIIISGLLEMEKRDRKARGKYLGIFHHVVLLGAPYSPSSAELVSMRRMVSGRFVNCFSKKDWILAVMQRASGSLTGIAGLGAIEIERSTSAATHTCSIENIDITDIIGGHLEYKNPDKIKLVLERTGLFQSIVV